MCIAIPGKILTIDGKRAAVDFNGTQLDINVAMVEANVGDYVLVHAGVAIEVLQQSQAEELQTIFDELTAAEGH